MHGTYVLLQESGRRHLCFLFSRGNRPQAVLLVGSICVFFCKVENPKNKIFDPISWDTWLYLYSDNMVNHFVKMGIKALEMPTSCHPAISSLLKTLSERLLCPGNCCLPTGRQSEGSTVGRACCCFLTGESDPRTRRVLVLLSGGARGCGKSPVPTTREASACPALGRYRLS